MNYSGCVSDCNYLLSCVRDDTLRLIDLRTNKIVKTFEQVIFIYLTNFFFFLLTLQIHLPARLETWILSIVYRSLANEIELVTRWKKNIHLSYIRSNHTCLCCVTSRRKRYKNSFLYFFIASVIFFFYDLKLYFKLRLYSDNS